MAVYLSAVRTALANQLGEDTISQPWPVIRDNSIQWALERISRLYDFDFGYSVQTVTTDSSGQIALAALSVRFDPDMDLRQLVAGTSNDHVFQPVDRSDFDNYAASDYVYYVNTDSTGSQTIVTNQPNTTLQLTASRSVPVISDVIPTAFPSAITIAKFALVYVREYEDKDSDTSVEEAKAQQALQEIISAEQRSSERPKVRTRYTERGEYMGRVAGDWL